MSFAVQSDYAFLNFAVRRAVSLGKNEIRRLRKKKRG
jgi:hypothetical protein